MRIKPQIILAIYSTILAACSGKTDGSQYQFNLNDATKPVLFYVMNLQELESMKDGNWSTLSSLYIYKDSARVSIPVALIGYSQNDTFFIKPAVVLGNGMEFEWLVYYKGDTICKRFKTPIPTASKNDSIKVLAVYPNKDNIPSNILLFHVFFSQAMAEDAQAYKYVHIINEAGVEIPFAWRQKASWSDSGRQLVLMVHPGRIKSGINYAKDAGPLFEPGKFYTFVVDDSIRPMIPGTKVKAYSKKLYVMKDDHKLPQFIPYTKVNILKVNTRQNLSIAFNEPMDYGAVSIGLEVKDSKGNTIKGQYHPINDSLWNFIPDHPWNKGQYQVMYNDYLADLASNHIKRAFEVQDVKQFNNLSGVGFVFKVGN